MNVLDNLQLGAMVVFKNDAIVDIWYGGTSVRTLCAETGDEIDIYHWTEAPANLEDAIEQAIDHEEAE